jgi:hypothetical protein
MFNRSLVPWCELNSVFDMAIRRSTLFWGSRSSLILVILLASVSLNHASSAQELKFPQIITIRYEAKDPHSGGQFIIWVEREKIWYGIDSKYGADTKIFPSAKTVDVMHITPAPGTTTITIITVTSVNSDTPDYFHLSGNVRFKISGMRVISSNVPQTAPQ